ncbi:hypothetical protein [Rhizobium sp. BK456]|uniref:hypothetical protein n=1 Tax=Rhizobium sp. BK456 TaxID=2587007 RepID=UPI00161ABF58|nr:hypothetical protein [Rhizobium sp. BK456]MBB3520802.1 hypothetical protein [Rhizobium sp. BK456]
MSAERRQHRRYGVPGNRGSLASYSRQWYFNPETRSRKEDHAMQYYFRHHRQRGPVNALQMRLQG